MRDLGKIRRQRCEAAESYYFGFENGNWAYFIICEATGLFAVHSDHGNASFCWPSWSGRMKEELTTSNPDYICGKLALDKHESWRLRLNDEESIEALKKAVEGDVDEDLLLEQIEDFETYLGDGGPDVAYYNLGVDLSEFFSGEFYEYMVYEHSPSRDMFQGTYIPFFQDWLRARGEAA